MEHLHGKMSLALQIQIYDEVIGLGIIWTLVVIKVLGLELIALGYCVQGEERLEDKV